MAIKAVLFDLFGTLTEATDIENIIIEKFELKKGAHAKLNQAICGQKFDGWRKYLDGVVEAAGIEKSPANREKMRGVVRDCFEKACKGVFPEAKRVLGELRKAGFKLGLVSEVTPMGRKILRETGLGRFFHEVILSYEVGLTKKGPKIYHECVERLGVKPEEIVMVGNSMQWDIMMAKEATGGKIRGILISRDRKQGAGNIGCAVVGSIAEVTKELGECRLTIK